MFLDNYAHFSPARHVKAHAKQFFLKEPKTTSKQNAMQTCKWQVGLPNCTNCYFIVQRLPDTKFLTATQKTSSLRHLMLLRFNSLFLKYSECYVRNVDCCWVTETQAWQPCSEIKRKPSTNAFNPKTSRVVLFQCRNARVVITAAWWCAFAGPPPCPRNGEQSRTLEFLQGTSSHPSEANLSVFCGERRNRCRAHHTQWNVCIPWSCSLQFVCCKIK